MIPTKIIIVITSIAVVSICPKYLNQPYLLVKSISIYKKQYLVKQSFPKSNFKSPLNYFSKY